MLPEPGVLEADPRGIAGLRLGGIDEGLERLDLVGETGELLALAGLVGVGGGCRIPDLRPGNTSPVGNVRPRCRPGP